jgi:acyl-CoA hydrolase
MASEFGRTSLTMRCEVRNKMNHDMILTIDKLVFVNLNEEGKPTPHGKTAITYVKDRLARE